MTWPRPYGRAIDWLFVLAGATAILGTVWHQMDIVGDGFWYIASGRQLLAHGVPHTDPFSYASVGARWMIVNPGACVAFAYVADHFGLRTLMMLASVVEVLALVLLWTHAARTLVARALLLGLALFFVQVDAEDLSVRGQLFGDLGFVLLLGLLGRLRDGKRVHPLWIVGGAAIWANAHTSFLMLLVVPLGAALLLQLESPEDRPRSSGILAIVPLALLGTMATPYGYRYVPFAFDLAFTRTNDGFDLFRSPDLQDPLWIAGPLLGFALLVVRDARGQARCRVAEQAFLLTFILAACFSRRYATELVAVEMALLGPILDRVVCARGRTVSVGLVVVSVGAVAFGLQGITHGSSPLRNSPVIAARIARAAQRKLVEEGRALNRVVNPLHWGGYLAYAWNGDPKYFIDGRDQVRLFGNGSFDDHGTLRAGNLGPPEMLEILDTYEAGVVLWERGFPLDAVLRQTPGWMLIHEDEFAVVYERMARR